MGKKDPSEKLLEDYADVFADIINVLAFHGERLLREEHIVPGPTASIYKDENQNLREQIRDIIKFDKKENSIFSVIGIENQSTTDPDMVFRVMGYDYASYRAQIDQNERNRYPVFSIVLYFGTKPWTVPKNLYDALDFDESSSYQKYLPELISNLKLNVIEVAYLPKEVRAQFTSDFRIIADYFCELRNGNEDKFFGDTRSFQHVEEMLDFFRIFSGDKRYQEIKKPLMKRAERGESISMCTLLDCAINKGMSQGISQGMSQGISQGMSQGISQGLIKGKLEAYYDLIGDGLLTVEQAAGKMGLSVSEFLTDIKKFNLGN